MFLIVYISADAREFRIEVDKVDFIKDGQVVLGDDDEEEEEYEESEVQISGEKEEYEKKESKPAKKEKKFEALEESFSNSTPNEPQTNRPMKENINKQSKIEISKQENKNKTEPFAVISKGFQFWTCCTQYNYIFN
jgi:hypothetical protein